MPPRQGLMVNLRLALTDIMALIVGAEWISTLDWKKVQHRIVLEIQVTTSIKDVIKRLLHEYYETRRLEIGPVSIKELSWNYKSDQYCPVNLRGISEKANSGAAFWMTKGVSDLNQK
jgi:hypothetical protein